MKFIAVDRLTNLNCVMVHAVEGQWVACPAQCTRGVGARSNAIEGRMQSVEWVHGAVHRAWGECTRGVGAEVGVAARCSALEGWMQRVAGVHGTVH